MKNVMISWIKEKSKLLDNLAREIIPHEECEDLSTYKDDLLMQSVKRCDNNSTKMFQIFQEMKVRKSNESMETNDPNLPSIVVLQEKWARSNFKDSDSRMMKEYHFKNKRLKCQSARKDSCCARGATVCQGVQKSCKLDPGRNDDCKYVVVEDPRSVDFHVRQGLRKPSSEKKFLVMKFCQGNISAILLQKMVGNPLGSTVDS